MHGLGLLKTLSTKNRIKSACYDLHEKEIVTLDCESNITFFKSDGRYLSSFLGVDVNQDTSNKFVKYLVPNKHYDFILYCSKEKRFIGWRKGEKEIFVSAVLLARLIVVKYQSV